MFLATRIRSESLPLRWGSIRIAPILIPAKAARRSRRGPHGRVGLPLARPPFPSVGRWGQHLPLHSLNTSIDQLLRDKVARRARANQSRNLQSHRWQFGGRAAKIVDGGAFTPTQATAFCPGTQSNESAWPNRGRVHSRSRGESLTEADATFCVQTVMLIRVRSTSKPRLPG